MARCCERRPGTGVDPEQVRRAVQGQPATLNPTEMRMAIIMKHQEGTGLQGLQQHFNYSRSQIADILQQWRERRR